MKTQNGSTEYRKIGTFEWTFQKYVDFSIGSSKLDICQQPARKSSTTIFAKLGSARLVSPLARARLGSEKFRLVTSLSFIGQLDSRNNGNFLDNDFAPLLQNDKMLKFRKWTMIFP